MKTENILKDTLECESENESEKDNKETVNLVTDYEEQVQFSEGQHSYIEESNIHFISGSVIPGENHK